MNNLFKKEIETKLANVFLAIFFGLVVFSIVSAYKDLSFEPSIPWPSLPRPGWPSAGEIKNIQAFNSPEDFEAYLQRSPNLFGYFDGGPISSWRTFPEVPPIVMEQIGGLGMAEGIGGGGPERVSTTNVQVVNIDEPDIVKTDGKEIYFSQEYWGPIIRPGAILREEMTPPYYQEIKTKVIRAFPASDLKKESEINQAGLLLLTKDRLVIFSGQEIVGFDVSDPKNPREQWRLELEENSSMVTSRLFKDKIYLVAQTPIKSSKPCPIKPLQVGQESLIVECQDIYHPVWPVPVDTTFLAMVLDPGTGTIEKKISFVGSFNTSVVYMSEQSLYLTYHYQESLVNFYTKFFREKTADLLPNWFLTKIEKLEDYDISEQAKSTELQTVWAQYFQSLDNDEQLKINNEINNRQSSYFKEHQRELEKTGIIKVGLDRFVIEAHGDAPGQLLNQFSLDEYQGHLRLATNLGNTWFFIGDFARPESVNDVYVLDKDLKIVGAIKGLGLTERIYSARFVEDKGYLVTFKQIDPFYVLDLSDPRNPVMRGELKIPGFSSYLHPINKERILGVGKEDWQVKLSLFDVADAANPKELDKYILDEGWSEVLSNYHAFLLDQKHLIFFLPGGQGGYIFSFKDDKLSLVKAVSDIVSRRALYLDDYLYILADKKIVVFNEIDWQKVKELEL